MDKIKLKLEIMGPERVYYEEENVESIVAEATDGELAVLPGHTSLLANLRIGRCIARCEDKERIFAVSSGLLEVKDDNVRIYTRAAEEARDIDRDRAERALNRANKMLESRGEKVDSTRARAALDRAENRMKVKELL